MEKTIQNQARLKQLKKLFSFTLFLVNSVLLYVFVFKKIGAYKTVKSCLESSGSKEKVQSCEEAISRLKKSGYTIATLSFLTLFLGVTLFIGSISKTQMQKLSIDRVKKNGVYKIATGLIPKKKKMEARIGVILFSTSMLFNISITLLDPDRKKTKAFNNALKEAYRDAKIHICLGTAFGYVAKIDSASPFDVAENKNLWVQLNTTCSKNSTHPHLGDRRIALYTPDFQLANEYIINY